MPLDAQSFGKRLNRFRKAQGLTSNALAEAIDVNPVHIRHMEGGARKPSIDSFVDLCNALQVSPDDLLADSLADHIKGQNTALAELIERLTPSQKNVVMATIEALLDMKDK